MNIKSTPSNAVHPPGMNMDDIRDNAGRAAELLKSMSNPARLMVLCLLTEGEKSVGELERIVPLSQSALSQHLAVLRRRNLVTTRRSGQMIYYSLAGVEASAVLATLYGLFCAEASDAAPSPERKPRSRAA